MFSGHLFPLIYEGPMGCFREIMSRSKCKKTKFESPEMSTYPFY